MMQSIRDNWAQLAALVIVALHWGQASADRQAMRRDIERLYSVVMVTQVDAQNGLQDHAADYAQEIEEMPTMSGEPGETSPGRPILFYSLQTAGLSVTPGEPRRYSETAHAEP